MNYEDGFLYVVGCVIMSIFALAIFCLVYVVIFGFVSIAFLRGSHYYDVWYWLLTAGVAAIADAFFWWLMGLDD